MGASEENYEYLLAKIDGFIRKYYLNRVIKGLLFLFASALIAFISIVSLEHLIRFNSVIRTFLFYLYIIINLWVIVVFLLKPLLSYFKLGNSINHEQASLIIGQHFKDIKDRLINTLQLKKLYESNPEQRELINASINQKVNELKPIPFHFAIKIEENLKYLKFILVPLAVIIILSLTAPSILRDSTTRIIHHKDLFVEKAPFEFIVLNPKLSAEQGSDFTLSVKIDGNQIPNEIYLEDGLNTFKLNKENNVRFNYTFKNIQKGRTFRLSAGKFKSDEYSISVKSKPNIIDFSVEIEYPKYLNKKSERIKNSGDLIVPEGSKINWNLKAQNSDVVDFQINNKVYRLSQKKDNLFNLGFRVLNNSNYRFKPIKKGQLSSEWINYKIQVIPDLLPEISINEIRDSTNKSLLFFNGQINDDYGFTKLTFNYRVLSKESGQKEFIKGVEFNKSSNQSSYIHVWDINSAGAKPGEDIEYYFEVFDNDGVNGPKSSKTTLKTVKIPSQKDLEEMKEARSERIKEKMEEAIKKSKELERESKKLNFELLNKSQLGFEEKKLIENLLKKQGELENLVKEIQNENQENILGEKEVENQEILDKKKQIENLFNNVLDEKTKEILKNIQKLLDKNIKEQSREDLSKVQMDNKSLQKELDRILELYKQLEFDQLLNSAIEKLMQLAKNQEGLSDKTKDKKTDFKELIQEQNKLNELFKDLNSDFSELNNKNEKLEQKNNFTEPEKDLNQINKDLKESINKLNNKDRKGASEEQKAIAESMKELSNELKKMQEEEEEEESNVNKNELRQLLENLLTLSFDQEKIIKELRGINTINPVYSQKIQQQKNIQDNFKLIEDSLYSLSKRIPQIQSVANKEVTLINTHVKNVLENLSERKTAEANREQQYAMTSINNLALMLNEVLEQLEQAQQKGNSKGKGKKKQSLSQLSKMQEELNKNMQKMRNQLENQGGQSIGKQGDRNRSMSESFAKMAREQQLIRQSLQEINRLENKDGKSGLGNLEKLIKEMEQSETDLVNKRIKEETLNRQKEILSKLLDAEKAENERDEDEKRESTEGKNQVPVNSKMMLEYLKNKNKEKDLLKTISPSFNSFYKIKVEDYFKFLNSGNK